MIFNINIDQRKSIEWGLNLPEAAVFSFCYDLPSWAEKVIINKDVFYFASRNKALNEIPLVTDKSDTIYRHYKTLQKKDLIEWKKIDGKDYIKLTEKAKSWNKIQLGKISERSDQGGGDSEKFPNEPGKISGSDSEKFPINKNTNIDKNTRDKEEDHPHQNGASPLLFDLEEDGASKKQSKKEKVVSIYSFDDFWDDYAMKSRGGKKKSKEKYYSLPLKSIQAIKDTLPLYLAATVTDDSQNERGKKWRPMRKNPTTYLNGKVWEDYEGMTKEEIDKKKQETPFDGDSPKIKSTEGLRRIQDLWKKRSGQRVAI